MSTNDYTNTDQTALQTTIPLEISQLQGSMLEKFPRSEQNEVGVKNILPDKAYSYATNETTSKIISYANAVSFFAKIKQNTSYIISKEGGNRFRLILTENTPAPGVDFSLVVDDATLNKYTFNSGTYNYVMLLADMSNSSVATIRPMLRTAADPDDTYVPYAMTNRELTEMFPTEYSTSGLTYTNCSYVSGGYCKIGKIVIVDIRVLTDSTSNIVITGFPGYNSKTVNNKNIVPVNAFNMTDDSNARYYSTIRNDGYLSVLGGIVANKEYAMSAVYLSN